MQVLNLQSYVIHGRRGSGKSTLGKHLRKTLSEHAFVIEPLSSHQNLEQAMNNLYENHNPNGRISKQYYIQNFWSDEDMIDFLISSAVTTLLRQTPDAAKPFQKLDLGHKTELASMVSFYTPETQHDKLKEFLDSLFKDNEATFSKFSSACNYDELEIANPYLKSIPTRIHQFKDVSTLICNKLKQITKP